MGIILPYKNELVHGNGGFISLNGEIKQCHATNIHEKLANKICCGSISQFRFIKGLSRYEITYDEYDGALSKQDFEIFKIWMSEHYKNNISFYGACSDFLLHVIGYDKVEVNRAITTSNNEPHIRFYNYYLLDHLILHLPKKIYNEELGKFITEKYIYIPTDEDIEMEKEINEIKEKVPIKERKLFLR